MQLITRAGGLTIFAKRRNIRVLRKNGTKVTEFVVDYDSIINGDLQQDILAVQPHQRGHTDLCMMR